MKNSNVYKFEIIEKIITVVNFTTKEEVVDFAEKVKRVALERSDLTPDIRKAFENAYKEIKDELTLANLKEIKKIITGTN